LLAGAGHLSRYKPEEGEPVIVLIVLAAVFIAAVVIALPVIGQFMREMVAFLARLLAVAFALAIAIILLVVLATHGTLV
jgi:hypothetical protein